MEDSRSDRFYYPQLDGLRFFAFLLVFIHNAPHDRENAVWKVLDEFGWIGVDLFFTLSAFLLARLLAIEYKNNQNINFSKFYIRRGLRILPLYFFYIIIVVGYSILSQESNDVLLLHTASLITFTYNLGFIFFIETTIIPFIHLWTISFEEQFYILLPFIIQKLSILSKKSRIIILVLFFFLGSSIRAILIIFQIKHPVIYMLPLTHFEGILGGLIIGLGIVKNPIKNMPKSISFFLGILFNYLATLLPDVNIIGWNLMLSYPLVGMGVSLILYSVIDMKGFLLNFVFNNKLFIYLGKVSYGLYIYHIVCIRFSIYIVDNLGLDRLGSPLHPIIIFMFGLCLTILVSTVSYVVIEKPFLKLKTKYSLIASRPI